MPPEVVVDIERQIEEYIAEFTAAFHEFWNAQNATPHKDRGRKKTKAK
ncbi:hypothetical protein [Candidatus Binatus sp.]|jgi:hypothetical protein